MRGRVSSSRGGRDSLLAVSHPCLHFRACRDASVSRVCNNCCWAFGELALRVGKPIAPMVPTVLELLAKVLSQANDETLPRSVLENTAVTMARMALQCPELFVEPGRFLFSWIRCAMLVEEAVEREHCFLGVSAVVCTFAPKLATFAVPLCHMVNAYEDPPASVKDAVKQCVHAGCWWRLDGAWCSLVWLCRWCLCVSACLRR